MNEVFDAEIAAIAKARESFDKYRFNYLVESLASLIGKAIVSGVGKSAICARKIAATLASASVASVFIDPIGLLHGESGLLRKGDLVLLVSASGETRELIELLPILKEKGCSVWSLVCEADSTLGRLPTSLHVGTIEDPIIPIPTATSAALVAVGDGVAIAVAIRKQFTEQQFIRNHPGGTIGKRATS